MYIMGADLYECDFCGVRMEWCETDEEHGTMWECEECGEHFCTQCFLKRHGGEAWTQNMRSDRLRCPECCTKVIQIMEG